MKSNQTGLVFGALILAGSVIGCNMFGGSNSNVANNSVQTNANSAPVAKAEDLPMFGAPKLIQMLMADTAGLNESLKDKEIIVIGVLSDTRNGVVVLGDPLWNINCTLAPVDDSNKGWPEKYQKLAAHYGAKKPIVEVRGVFTKGTFETEKGVRYVGIYLDKCTILSIKE